jgi:O-antigen/teichoic acid export membrane protein
VQYRILAATNFIFYMQFQQLLRQGIVWRGLYFVTMFVLNVVISRLFKADISGWLNYLMTIFFLVALVVNLNVESGIAYYVASKLIPRQTVLSFTVIASLILLLVVTIGMIVYANFFPDTHLTTLNFIVFGVSIIIGTHLLNVFVALFQAEENFVTGNIAAACVNMVLVFVLLICHHFGVAKNYLLGIYSLSFITQGIVAAVAYFIKVKPIQQMQLPNKEQLQLLLRYALLALLGNVVFFFVYRIDYWFVNKYCLPADLGNYIQASKMGQLLLVLPQILASVVFPKSATSDNLSFIPQQILIISRLLMQCILLVILGTICFGKTIFTGVFGSSFNTMDVAFSWLLPGIFSLSILAVLSAYFSGQNQIKVNITGAVLALMVILLGDFLFVKQYGIVAAAIVSSIGYTVNVVYSFYHFFRQNTIRVNELWCFKKSDYRWVFHLLTNKTD